MQELKVIGIEDGSLVAVSDEGDRFLVQIDAVMQTKIRQLQTERAGVTRISPREIQSLIRAGLSREEVAAATGASIDDIERYEGPVLAERENMLATALAVPVHVAGEDGHNEHTFGSVIRARLADVKASNERWACWKDETRGWMLKVEFVSGGIDHDARWSFEPRSQVLQPLSSEAITLSQQGEIRGGLIPKLRAVDADAQRADSSRFDSGQFVPFDESANTGSLGETQPLLDTGTIALEHSSPAATEAATNRADEPEPNDTADLLEALRKRRGEREAAPAFDIFEEHSMHTGELDEPAPGTAARELWANPTGPVRAQAAPIDNHTRPFEPNDAFAQAATQNETANLDTGELRKRKGRTSLPSWDEIVFGARGDDDSA